MQAYNVADLAEALETWTTGSPTGWVWLDRQLGLDASKPRYQCEIASSAEAIEASQRLRYRVFAQEMGASLESGMDFIDVDAFDTYAEHLLVRDAFTNEVVACTRILNDSSAKAAGSWYSAQEFDLGKVLSLPGRKLEIGRTCVDSRFRNGAVIAVLWQGLAQMIKRYDAQWLFGCASLTMTNSCEEDSYAAVYLAQQQCLNKQGLPIEQRLSSLNPIPTVDLTGAQAAKLPPLLKAYISLGAKIGGEFFYDEDFQCADAFILLQVSEINQRYARHFGIV